VLSKEHSWQIIVEGFSASIPEFKHELKEQLSIKAIPFTSQIMFVKNPEKKLEEIFKLPGCPSFSCGDIRIAMQAPLY
jgi:hypothetical protein